MQGESQWKFEGEKVRSAITDSKIFLLSFVRACRGRISSVHVVFFAQVPKSESRRKESCICEVVKHRVREKAEHMWL